MYRNTWKVTTFQKVEIERNALWKKEGDLMILVDDDQYITTPYSKFIFEKEEKKKKK